jgi:hypothetical protein
LEVIWLLRGLTPDFKTIADFRKDNRRAFKPVFRQFVLLCRKLDLFGGELLAVDGTRLKAVNSTERNYKGEGISACEAAGIEAYVPRPQRGFAVREGLFRKEEFRVPVRCTKGRLYLPRQSATSSAAAGRSRAEWPSCGHQARRFHPLLPERYHRDTYHWVDWPGKKLFARQAEVFAAYTAYTDHEIGRVIQQVQDMGKLDNTLIIYIDGDNGTSPEDTLVGLAFWIWPVL